MKKQIAALLALLMILGGCGGNAGGQDKQGPAAAAPADGAANAVAAEAGEQASEDDAASIEVDKGLLSTELTLPASMFEGRSFEEISAEAKEKGVEEVKQNEDGSITYKMSRSAYNEMLKEAEAGLLEAVEDLKSGEDFKSIRDVTHNKTFNEFTLVVEKSQFENSFDGFAVFAVGISAMYYQLIAGVSPEENKVTIHLKDQGSGEVFNTIVYPDHFED